MHVARCGTPVLFHDDTLERTTNGSGRLADQDFAALFAAGRRWMVRRRLRGRARPFLAAALTEATRRSGRIYPEVKRYDSPGDLDRMAELVRKAELVERTVFISMDWESLDHLGTALPGAHLGYIVEERSRFEDGLERVRGRPRRLLDFDARLILAEPTLVESTREVGADVAVWTINDPTDAEALARAGVRRVTTNEVGRLLRWREER